jgi:hypothetical protein
MRECALFGEFLTFAWLRPDFWTRLSDNPDVALFSAVTGGILSAFVALIVVGVAYYSFLIERRQVNVARIIRESHNMLSMMEAWILEGPGYQTNQITEFNVADIELMIDPPGHPILPWFRSVEIRAILDQGTWTPPIQFLCFARGRRMWIVRNRVYANPSYGNPARIELDIHPAIISSRGLAELRFWIESVARFKIGTRYNRCLPFTQMLSDGDLRELKSVLVAVAGTDRREWFGVTISDRSRRFLEKVSKRFRDWEIR